MTITAYVDEILRIANHFFSKYRIQSFDKDLRLTSNDLSNLSTIQHAIQIRFSHIKEMDGTGNSDNKIIKLVKEYINAHLQHQVTLAEAAGHVHFNPTYFSEYFKEKTGETFMQYITRIKIKERKPC
jgi:two-component system response regulator YesN